MPSPADAQLGALFVSKSVATRQPVGENTPFTQTVVLKNMCPDAWTGCTMVRLASFGAANKPADLLGAASSSVAVPVTAAGATASINLSLKGVKSNPKSGAAQAAPWELRRPDGGKITIFTAPGTPAKGGAVWTVVSLNPAAGNNLPDLRNAAYTDPSANLYVQIGNGGQCTAFVYGRIKEKLKIDLRGVPTFGSNAAGQKWIDQLTGAGKPYQFSAAPRANSIAVWTLNSDPNNGHVAFVEAVDAAGNIQLNEANGSSYASFAADNGPDSDTWGGGYDGRLKSVPAAQMNGHLGPAQSLKGYIYVG
ncbi:MAG TPA: CHAP domain-containing protein [Candidatus Peribacteria bacterium]|nr:CHAP domain-containing protein [Candidatus Peribacteria bacterium]